MIIAAQMWIFSRMPDLDAQIFRLLCGLAECGCESIKALAGKAPHDLAALQAAPILCGAVHLVPSGLAPLEPLLDTLNAVGARHLCSFGPLMALPPRLSHLERLVVEQDPSPTPLEDMQASRRCLRDTSGL